jgi:hypothetical protein
MIPKYCHLEDLRKICPPLFPNVILLSTFVGHAGLSRNLADARKILVWTVDRAVLQFRLARQAVLDEIEERSMTYQQIIERNEGQYLHMLTFTEHMEDCVAQCRKALRLLDQFKNSPLAPKLDRNTKKLIEAQAKELVDVRNLVEHIDEEIRQGSIQAGKSLLLCLSDDDRSIAIGDQSIGLAALASMLKGLHRIAAALLD